MKSLVLLLALLSAALPATAMNKCTAPSGAVSFQDLPCRGELRDGVAVAPPATAAPAAPAAEKPSPDSARKRELEKVLLPKARSEFAAQRSKCERELAALKTRIDAIGDRHPAQRDSLVQQRRASQASCDASGRQLADQLEILVAECAALQCAAR